MDRHHAALPGLLVELFHHLNCNLTAPYPFRDIPLSAELTPQGCKADCGNIRETIPHGQRHHPTRDQAHQFSLRDETRRQQQIQDRHGARLFGIGHHLQRQYVSILQRIDQLAHGFEFRLQNILAATVGGKDLLPQLWQHVQTQRNGVTVHRPSAQRSHFDRVGLQLVGRVLGIFQYFDQPIVHAIEISGTVVHIGGCAVQCQAQFVLLPPLLFDIQQFDSQIQVIDGRNKFRPSAGVQSGLQA
mmetsp:Transcript_11068/g.31823  ORF Transcript_11068/g.31823 Transcript_11068/m.31823 type:complete len:244 (+) Transcript_11068:660-1391(+)